MVAQEALALGFGFQVLGFGDRRFGLWDSGLGFGFGVRGFGFRVWVRGPWLWLDRGSGLKVQGSGLGRGSGSPLAKNHFAATRRPVDHFIMGRGRLPGVGRYARIFGCGFLVLPSDEDGVPFVYGKEPVGCEMRPLQPRWGGRRSR